MEDSNQEQIAQVARALMEVYLATHTPKFAVDLPREVPLAMRFSEQEEENFDSEAEDNSKQDQNGG